jgi:integrase
MKPTFKIYPRLNAKKVNGDYPFYCRLTINRTAKWYALGISLSIPGKSKSNELKKEVMLEEKRKELQFLKRYWDPKTIQVKKYPGSVPSHLDQLNQDLAMYDNKARKIIHDYNINGQELTFDEFKNQFWSSVNARTSFYDFAVQELGMMKKKSAPSETLRSYNSYITKLKQYRDKLNFNDITLDFINNYHGYMLTDLKNCENTCNTSLAFIRTMLNRAITKGIIKNNVFDKYSIKRVPGHREFLTPDELENLEDLFMSTKLKRYESNILRYFLFSCYTGLRFQDIKNLRFLDLKNEVHDKNKVTLIKIKMHKTKDEVSIPVIKKALDLVPEGFQNQKVFKVNTNQVTNRNLKLIYEKVGISKNITFHSARHTFATMGITLGIPIEVISKLLGHRDLKATGIYAKIVDDKKIREMKKWGPV